VVQVGPGVEIEEFLDLVGVMGGQVVDDAVQVVTKLSEQVEPVTQPATVPSCTLNPANRTAVPLRSYSSSLRSFLPGAARTVGLTRALAWIEVFSSTDQTELLLHAYLAQDEGAEHEDHYRGGGGDGLSTGMTVPAGTAPAKVSPRRL
jgi:hypothetical protein